MDCCFDRRNSGHENSCSTSRLMASHQENNLIVHMGSQKACCSRPTRPFVTSLAPSAHPPPSTLHSLPRLQGLIQGVPAIMLADTASTVDGTPPLALVPHTDVLPTLLLSLLLHSHRQIYSLLAIMNCPQPAPVTICHLPDPWINTITTTCNHEYLSINLTGIATMAVFVFWLELAFLMGRNCNGWRQWGGS